MSFLFDKCAMHFMAVFMRKLMQGVAIYTTSLLTSDVLRRPVLGHFCGWIAGVPVDAPHPHQPGNYPLTSVCPGADSGCVRNGRSGRCLRAPTPDQPGSLLNSGSHSGTVKDCDAQRHCCHPCHLCNLAASVTCHFPGMLSSAPFPASKCHSACLPRPFSPPTCLESNEHRRIHLAGASFATI